jgi:hypothetical protein
MVKVEGRVKVRVSGQGDGYHGRVKVRVSGQGCGQGWVRVRVRAIKLNPISTLARITGES